VPNETARLSFGGQNKGILDLKKQKQIESATSARVRKEMARPRMAMSTRIKGLILGAVQVPAAQKAPMTKVKNANKRRGVKQMSPAAFPS